MRFVLVVDFLAFCFVGEAPWDEHLVGSGCRRSLFDGFVLIVICPTTTLHTTSWPRSLEPAVLLYPQDNKHAHLLFPIIFWLAARGEYIKSGCGDQPCLTPGQCSRLIDSRSVSFLHRLYTFLLCYLSSLFLLSSIVTLTFSIRHELNPFNNSLPTPPPPLPRQPCEIQPTKS